MSTLAGTPTLARLALRRDRVRLPVWVLAMTLLTYSSGSAMATTFPTQASIDSYASSMATSPSVVFLAGPPVALDTLAGIVLNKVSFLGLVGVCLMTVLQVVRHTRAEEEEGRAELVRAGVVGRDAAPVATMLVTGAAALLVGAGQAVATAAAQVPVADALLYGASVAALGLVFAAIALCTAQVFTHARAASGSAMAIFGVAYVVRGVGDVQDNGLVWLSPIGWSQATHATGADATWWPLLVPVVVTLLLVGLAAWLQRSARPGGRAGGRPARPCGGGPLPVRRVRPGPAHPAPPAARLGRRPVRAGRGLRLADAGRRGPGPQQPDAGGVLPGERSGQPGRLVPRHDAAGARAAGRRLRRRLGAAPDLRGDLRPARAAARDRAVPRPLDAGHP